MPQLKPHSNTKIAFGENLEKRGHLTFLSVVSQLLSLSVPNLYNYNGLSVWYVLYASSVLLVLLVLYIWNIFYKIENYYSTIDKTAVIDILVATVFTITNMVCVWCAIFSKRRDLVNAIKQFAETNIPLAPTSMDKHNKCSSIMICTIIIHVLFVSSIIYCIALNFMDTEIFHIEYQIITFVNLYMVIIKALQISTYCQMPKKVLKALNDKLLNVVNQMKKFKNPKKSAAASYFPKTHDEICDSMDFLNASQGLPILATSFVFVLQPLQTLNLVLKYVVDNQASSPTVKINDVALHTIWTFILLACGIVMSLSCDEVKNEAQRSEIICYKLLMELPARNNLNQESDLRENLLRLAQQVRFRKPMFSAVNCLAVDSSFILKVFGTVVGHVVILMQFN